MELISAYMDMPWLTISQMYMVRGPSTIFHGYFTKQDKSYLYFGNMLNQWDRNYSERMISPDDILSIKKVMP